MLNSRLGFSFVFFDLEFVCELGLIISRIRFRRGIEGEFLGCDEGFMVGRRDLIVRELTGYEAE